MYRAHSQPELPDFYLPFVEKDYRTNFADSGMVAAAKESRIALGALTSRSTSVLPTKKPSPSPRNQKPPRSAPPSASNYATSTSKWTTEQASAS